MTAFEVNLEIKECDEKETMIDLAMKNCKIGKVVK